MCKNKFNKIRNFNHEVRVRLRSFSLRFARVNEMLAWTTKSINKIIATLTGIRDKPWGMSNLWLFAKFRQTKSSWLVAALLGALAIVGIDAMVDVFEELATMVLEFVQERLETFYTKVFKMGLYDAQMATAYSGFLILTGLVTVTVRKMAGLYQDCLSSWRGRWCQAWRFVDHWRGMAEAYWKSVDGFKKVLLIFALVNVLIPVVSIVCLVLGKLIADFV